MKQGGNDDKVLSWLRAGGSADAGAISSATGIPRPSVRRSLADLRASGRVAVEGTGRRTSWRALVEAPTVRRDPTSAVREALAQRESGELPVPDGTLLGAILPKGMRHDLADIVKRVQQHFTPVSSRFTPAELARELGVTRSAVARILRRLATSGEVVQDEARGPFRLAEAEGAEGISEEEAEEWIRESAEVAGFDKIRIFTDKDGVERITHHSPARKGGSHPPSGPPPVDAVWGGRKLRMSPDHALGKRVPVLFTPMSILEVIDADGPSAETRPADAIGFTPTPNGLHWYRLAGLPPSPVQDPTFAEYSEARHGYHERLFHDDGSPRTPPRQMNESSPWKVIEFHRRAWIAAQNEVIKRGLQLGEPLKPEDKP